MTVQELIDKLSGIPLDALVFTEGCDCTMAAAGVSVITSVSGTKVTITRE